ncbi:MAG TPA: Crp/Fnr family transcriptional regulator [Pyrinomonadaceae bacterium]|nr:Crp/Fnr family transcriptional regulator [Pyrinomonadaceae bacterium]
MSVATSLSCAGAGTNEGGHHGGPAARHRSEAADINGHRLQLFDGLGHGDMSEITAAARSLRKERGEFVYTPGDPAETVYVLKQGRIKLSVLSESGKEFAIDIFQPGDIFGEFALADEETRSNMAQALDSALMWVFRKRDFVRLLETRPKLAMNYIRLVGRRRRRMEKKLSDITAKDVAARVCELLHEVSTSSADADASAPELLVPLTHQDVASLIGAARQTTTTVLNDLERRDIIELGRGWIRVTRLKELQVYVGSLALACAQIIFHNCQLADSLLTAAPT